jgi:predicted O-methyltransferase YrrM
MKASKELLSKTLSISKWVAANMHGRDEAEFKRIYHCDHHIALYIKDYVMKEQCKTYFEIGAHFGHSICTLLQSQYKSNFITCDLFDSGASNFYTNKNVQHFNSHNYNCEIIKANSNEEGTRDLVNDSCPDGIDLLFIDGDHRYWGVTKDFQLYFPLVNSGGYIVFDDYLPFSWKGKERECPVAIRDIIKKHEDELEIMGEAKSIDPDDSLGGTESIRDNTAFIVKKK